MDALGITMAFLFFWSLVGVGLALTIRGAIGLVPKESRIGLVAGLDDDTGTTVAQELMSKIMLAAGMLMIYVGGSATYNALFQ